MEFQPQVQCVGLAESRAAAPVGCDGIKAPFPGGSMANPACRAGMNPQGSSRTGFICYCHRKLLQWHRAEGTVTKAILPATNPAVNVLSLLVLSGGFWHSERSCLGNKQLNNQWEKRPGESSCENLHFLPGAVLGLQMSLFLHCSGTVPFSWWDLRGASLGVWLEALWGWVTQFSTIPPSFLPSFPNCEDVIMKRIVTKE